jgi:hypothetical protein
MEFVIFLVLVSVVISVVSAVAKGVSSASLQNKFVGLGTLAGRSKQEIITIVGQPNSVSALPEGKSILQWMATGYHIALVFNGEICEGVSHEFANG